MNLYTARCLFAPRPRDHLHDEARQIMADPSRTTAPSRRHDEAIVRSSMLNTLLGWIWMTAVWAVRRTAMVCMVLLGWVRMTAVRAVRRTAAVLRLVRKSVQSEGLERFQNEREGSLRGS